MTTKSLSLFLLSTTLLVSCHSHHRTGRRPVALVERAVSMDVEVFDPQTNFVWQDVSVRIVEANVESEGVNTNPIRDDWYLTDQNGLVSFGPADLAAADVGFCVDDLGQAVLHPELDRDQAVVLIEVWAPGYKPVLWEVEVDWEQPDVFVQIPFGDPVPAP